MKTRKREILSDSSITDSFSSIGDKMGCDADQAFVLAVIQDIRDSRDDFAEQFSEVDDFYEAEQLLSILRTRYPDFQKKEIDALLSRLEDKLFKLFLQDNGLIQASVGLVSEQFFERIMFYQRGLTGLD